MTETEKADLAEAMVPVACRLAGAVRDDPDEVARILREHSEHLYALVVVLAAMVPEDQTPRDLLAWVNWTPEHLRLVRLGVNEDVAREVARGAA